MIYQHVIDEISKKLVIMNKRIINKQNLWIVKKNIISIQ